MNSSRNLKLGDIVDMCAYEGVREGLRSEVIEVKRRRRIGLGTVVTIMFENRTTIKSQFHEMLRSIAEEIQAETPTRENVTAAVHYSRFKFTPNQVALFESGGAVILCDLTTSLEATELPPLMVTELLSDLR